MIQEIAIAIFTSLIWIVIILIIISRKNRQNLELLKNKEIEFEKEKNIFLEKINGERKVQFERGFESGISKSDFIIQVDPYKNIISRKSYFKNNQIMEIGYIYRLFVKNIPSLDPHIQIIERVKTSDINETNINAILDQVNKIISKIPSPHLKVTKNVKDFGNEILKSIKTKRK